MRTFQVIESFGRGGAERHVLDLSSGLTHQGHPSVPIGRAGPLAIGASYFPVTEGRRYCGWTEAFTRAQVTYGAPNLVHVHSTAPLPAAIAYTRRRGIPLVFTVHGWSARKLRVGSHLLRRLPIDQILLVSDSLRSQFYGGRVTVVRNAVPDRCPEPILEDDPDNFDVVSVGRLASPKQQSDLIRAVELVRDQIPAIRLTLVGEGPDRGVLENLVRDLRMSDVVHFAGYTDPLPLLRRARLFASSSLSEGLALAQIEALMCGLPLIVTATSGAQEVVSPGRNGLIVPIGDVASIARAIASLLTQDLSEHRSISRERYEEDFAFSRMLTDLLNAYGQAFLRRGVLE